MCAEVGSEGSAAGSRLLGHPDILRHVVDVHCHPTDSEISPHSMTTLPVTLCAMATRMSDQHLVRQLASAYPDKVVPCFGYHPWFAHYISLQAVSSKEEHYRNVFSDWNHHPESFHRLLPSLPNPVPLEDIIAEVRTNLASFPNAMLGEVGLDRTARIPYDYFASVRELTPFSVSFDHQLTILEAQIELAVELGRNISMHSVKSQKATSDLLQKMQKKYDQKWYNISLDLHSCGFSPEMWMDIETRHVNVFLSLSTAINGRSPNHRALIAVCSPGRILAESDSHTIDQTTGRTWDMILTIAEVKGWKVEMTWLEDVEESEWGVVRHLEENWKRFQKGGHTPNVNKRSGRR